MNSFSTRLIALLAIVLSFGSLSAADFYAGDKIRIKKAAEGDVYVAAGEVKVEAVIGGDLHIASGDVVINDSIGDDLVIAAGRVEVNGKVGDDLRVFGGDVLVNRDVMSDVLVFGGKLTIAEEVTVHGDVICMGGEVEMEGMVKGHLNIKGGNIEIEGRVEGNVDVRGGHVEFDAVVGGHSIIAAKELSLEEGAQFNGNVRYWTGGGEVDFSAYLNGATATYDESLELRDSDFNVNTKYLGLGIFMYWVYFLVSSLILLLVLATFFDADFRSVAAKLNDVPAKSIGIGVVFFLGVPAVIVILLCTLVGIPLALMVAAIYGFAILVANALAALAVTYYFERRTGQSWSKTQMVAYALLVLVLFKLVFLVPFVGSVAKNIVVAMAFGATILTFNEKWKARKARQSAASSEDTNAANSLT